MDEITIATVRITSDERKADEWALVLLSASVRHRLARTASGFELQVMPEDAQRALRALSAFDEESPTRTPVEVVTGPAPLWQAGVGASMAILLMQAALHAGWLSPATKVWFEQGSSRAERVLDGEWWRVVTALTLHGDVGHVLGNAAGGALFVTALCRILGGGVGIAATVAAGAFGNLINAAVYRTGHNSIGASTALFGAIGALGVLEFRRRKRAERTNWRKLAWLPVAASVGLLAVLGTGGADNGMEKKTDLLAHLFGFIAGGAVAFGVAPIARRPPGAIVQAVLLAATGCAIAGAWYLALG